MRKLTLVLLGAFALSLALSTVACSSNSSGAGMGAMLSPKVYQAGGDNYSIFHDLMKTASLDKTLDQGGPYTVFAPNNSAFNALPQGTVEDLKKPQNCDQLINILTSHVIRGQFNTTDLASGTGLTAMNGTELTIERKAGLLAVNGARIVDPNIGSSNGIVQGVDALLVR